MRTTLAFLCLATAAAHAGDHNELTLGTSIRALRSGSANAVTADSLAGGTLTYGRRLDLSLIPELESWLTAGVHWGGAGGVLFQTVTTDVDMLGFTGGARARYVLHPNLVLAARLDLGTARTTLAIEGNGARVTDAGWGATFGGALGLDAYAIAHRSFSLGLRAELGYVAMTAPSLSPREGKDETMLLLDEQQASIGHLDLGGRYVTISAIAQF